jgi:Ser/Thr protein kinase RdoA (MazF antagonist)
MSSGADPQPGRGHHPDGVEETRLAGGTLSTVVRIGETVHRPAGSWTSTVHALLRHIRTRGFSLAPEPLGFDADGREVLSYLDGSTVGAALPWPEWVWREELLAEVGQATARYHEAVADFRPSGILPWHWGAAELKANEIVCHNDLAPYNVVVGGGRLRGIIDWDLVFPGTIRSELAFVAWQWVPLQDPSIASVFGWRDRHDLGRRLRILLDGYGLADRSGFIEDVILRIKQNRDVIVRRAREGVTAYIELERQGHVVGMNRAVAFLAEVGAGLQAAL